MKSSFGVKGVVVIFLLTLAFYLAGFYGIEYLRHRKGPWVITFLTGTNGQPSIVIYQPKLDIESVSIAMPGEKTTLTNLSKRIVFDRPRQPIPFGATIHEDLLSFPGVLTFNFFGHFVEILPRVLNLDHKEIEWKRTAAYQLSPTNKVLLKKKPAAGKTNVTTTNAAAGGDGYGERRRTE